MCVFLESGAPGKLRASFSSLEGLGKLDVCISRVWGLRMDLNGLEKFRTRQNGSELLTTASNNKIGLELFRIDQNCAELLRIDYIKILFKLFIMVQNGMELFRMNQACLELLGLVQNGFELFGTNGLELIRIGQNGSENGTEWFGRLQNGSAWRSMG